MRLTLVTDAATEPITTAEAKTHLRVDFTDDDTYIDGLITAARKRVEAQARRALVNQTWRLGLDKWPVNGVITLPRYPLVSVTSVTYYDTADSSAVYASSNYLVDTDSQPGRLILNDGAEWPATTLRPGNPIEVVFVAGHGAAAANVPEMYKQAIKLLVGHYYENREPVIVGQGLSVTPLPMAVDDLLNIDRRSWF